jgi:hypothetical protein
MNSVQFFTIEGEAKIKLDEHSFWLFDKVITLVIPKNIFLSYLSNLNGTDSINAGFQLIDMGKKEKEWVLTHKDTKTSFDKKTFDQILEKASLHFRLQ